MRIRAISWNVWGEQGDPLRHDALVEAVTGMAADIWCFQEVTRVGDDGGVYGRIAEALPAHHVWFQAHGPEVGGVREGVAIASRVAATHVESIALPYERLPDASPRTALLVRLEGGLVVVCAHVVFASPRLRMRQIEALMSATRHESRLVVGADLNTIPPDIAEMSRHVGLVDSLGWHPAPTWPVIHEGVHEHAPQAGRGRTCGGYGAPAHPGRLDYVLVRGVRVLGTGRVNTSWVSDHAPVWADVAVGHRPPGLSSSDPSVHPVPGEGGRSPASTGNGARGRLWAPPSPGAHDAPDVATGH